MHDIMYYIINYLVSYMISYVQANIIYDNMHDIIQKAMISYIVSIFSLSRATLILSKEV
jgi:hypothetical protein